MLRVRPAACGFVQVMFQGGGWPYFEDPGADEAETITERLNCQKLFSLLESTGDSTVELYGIWDGDFAEAPAAHDNIPLEAILEPDFRFKERGFYEVVITRKTLDVSISK
jgi:hypothetical protein